MVNVLENRMNAECVWSLQEWETQSARLHKLILATRCDQKALRITAKAAGAILKAYSSSFYLVTRFLPLNKRRQVQLIYAAVRYPDELVDTFAQQGIDVHPHLDRWEQDYETALQADDFTESVLMGCNPYLAAFVAVVKANTIPTGYYRSFMRAMRMDLAPRPFESLDDLIDGFIYGSAIVVGYFLTHVYGAREASSFDKAMQCAKDLAIALQITNFARDFSDDHRRGRIYVPLQFLQQSGIKNNGSSNRTDHITLLSARRRMAEYAKAKYSKASANVQHFNPDSQMAIESCIKVYSLLNDKILHSSTGLGKRISVPATHKFAVLPASKYWRLPLSYAGLI